MSERGGVNRIPCAGHGHIEEPPFLLVASLVPPADGFGEDLLRQVPLLLLACFARRKAPFAETGDKDDGPFQALSLMNGEDVKGVVGGDLLTLKIFISVTGIIKQVII
jgi:hypothetical protein